MNLEHLMLDREDQIPALEGEELKIVRTESGSGSGSGSSVEKVNGGGKVEKLVVG